MGRIPGQSGRRVATGSAHPRRTAQAGQQHSSDAGLSRPISQRSRSLPDFLCSTLSKRPKEGPRCRDCPRSTKRTRCHRSLDSQGRATQLSSRFWRPMRPSCPSASCSTRNGDSRALSRQGSSPSGAKRRSRFERSRRARPKGRRPTLVLVSVWVLVLDCSLLSSFKVRGTSFSTRRDTTVPAEADLCR